MLDLILLLYYKMHYNIVEMRRHTAKGVVSSVKLGREGGGEFPADDTPQSKGNQSKQRKRKSDLEENVSSDEPIANVKKKKT